MPNKRFNEDEDGDASLPQKVKGKKEGEGASFKPLSHPDGAGDDQEFGGFGAVKNAVEMPQDKEKKLPKAGGLS